ncbi:MAG: ABC transporter permease [Candidatus Omnitrophota bacterium]
MNRPNFLWDKFKQNKIALLCLWVVVSLYLVAIFADFLSVYNYDNEERNFSFCPPTRINFVDGQGKFHLVPFVYGYSFSFNQYYQRVYKEDKSQVFHLNLLARGDGYKFLGLFKTDLHLLGLDSAGRLYLFGADSRGRDLYSRILYGARVSLSIGIIGVSVSFLIGLLIGGISGYYGGRIDNLIMRLCEMVMMIPGFYLMLALRAAFPTNLSSTQVFLLLIFILSFIGWAGMARVIRGISLSLKEREFVLAARVLGISDLKIILRHILPHTLSYAIVALTLSIPGYILGESGLSFIGLGIQDPQASWGNLLSDAMNISAIKFYPWILLPGVFIFITVMAFNLLGEGLRDAFDPRMKMVFKSS